MGDRAEKWLKANDPDYDLKHNLEYPYLSFWGEHKVKKKEIPMDPSKIMYLATGRRIIN